MPIVVRMTNKPDVVTVPLTPTVVVTVLVIVMVLQDGSSWMHEQAVFNILCGSLRRLLKLSANAGCATRGFTAPCWLDAMTAAAVLLASTSRGTGVKSAS